MTKPLSILAFVSSQEAAERWYSAMSRLPSTLRATSELSAGRHSLCIKFKDRIGGVSLTRVDSQNQLWVMEVSGRFRCLFHWFFVYCGAMCISESTKWHESCTTMLACDVSPEEADSSLEHRPSDIFIESPSEDLAMLYYSAEEGNEARVSCVLKIRLSDTSSLILSDGPLPVHVNALSVRELPKCVTEKAGVRFVDIWSYR